MIKTIKIAGATLLCSVLLLSSTSCFVAVSDHGHHKGKQKNSNNPHHPRTTNPGHTKKNK